MKKYVDIVSYTFKLAGVVTPIIKQVAKNI